MERDQIEPEVTELPGERAAQWVEHHDRYAATSTHVYPFVWNVDTDAIGPFCRDVDGNILMDFTSHVASSPLGYNNPALMEKLRDFDLVDPMKYAGQDFYASMGWPPKNPEYPGPSQLMERLTEFSSHYDMDTVFLSNSGAEAVENSIKICYDNRGTRGYGVTFTGAFHGRTLGALSLNRSKSVHRKLYPEIPGIDEENYCRDPGCSGGGSCKCGFFINGVSGLKRTLAPRGSMDPDDVAYIILEPVQGEGGFHVPSDAFMDEITEICSDHGIPLIADEIQSGIGRTGEMWASDHFSIEPDVIASAKAGRVGATISRRDVFPDERGRLSSTWGGGDLLASIQGCLTFDVLVEQDLMDNARRRGVEMRELVMDSAPGSVVDVRGLGLMIGVELESQGLRDDVLMEAFKRGLLVLACGRKAIRVLPPLDVREREVRIGVELLMDAVEAAG